MARRVAWWVAVEGVAKDEIIAFTFTKSAAEELKFRIRRCLEMISPAAEEVTLGGMYIGTIHGFCLKALREFAPDEFYMFDVVDEAGRISLIEQGFHNVLALSAFQRAVDDEAIADNKVKLGKFRSEDLFLRGYDLLNEYDKLDVTLSSEPPPSDVSRERDWCGLAKLNTDVGSSERASAFADSAARYYAYLRTRRFLDFSTVETETTRRLRDDPVFRKKLTSARTRLVVDEIQDINPVQYRLIRDVVGQHGFLTAVGDHRQAIYSFRGGRIEMMGELHRELSRSKSGYVQELPSNYRSTPRIINLANEWATKISDTAGMSNPSMIHARATRKDMSKFHVARFHFSSRDEEAEWIASTISRFVRTSKKEKQRGASHDGQDGKKRGLTLADIAVLVRSGTDIRTYQKELRENGIPSVVRGGPDLFAQPEVLLFLGALGLCAGLEKFYGSEKYPYSMPGRIRMVLGVNPVPNEVVPAALEILKHNGLAIPDGTEERLLLLCQAVAHRLMSDDPQTVDLSKLRCSPECRSWLVENGKPRRIFPQRIFHWLLREAGIHSWGTDHVSAESALFHVGQLSSLVMAIETPGWTQPDGLKWRLIALLSWGSASARTPEAPLLVSPDAVSITTIHSAKGLEFGAVFLADVCARRFPNLRARSPVDVPFDRAAGDYVDPLHLSDNSNYDNERRLMYVALTRAERYLYITASGSQQSRFFRELGDLVGDVGGFVGNVGSGGCDLKRHLKIRPGESKRDDRLTTTFSDLRYYLECPHDFYLRKVLGFTPTIGQEFGYGRGLHNLLRAVHSDPKYWAQLAGNRRRLRREVQKLIKQGLFYLRYTVGEPLENLQRSALRGVVDYVEIYSEELAKLEFEPEREFETVIREEDLLIGGAIDVLRLDDPPRITIVDFKSGDGADETGTGLNREMMELQIGVYGLAAREELEYEPQQGVIRYIGETDKDLREVPVDLQERELERVRRKVIKTGRKIRERQFDRGPTGRVRNRCARCDFLDICPRKEAVKDRK